MESINAVETHLFHGIRRTVATLRSKGVGVSGNSIPLTEKLDDDGRAQ